VSWINLINCVYCRLASFNKMLEAFIVG